MGADDRREVGLVNCSWGTLYYLGGASMKHPHLNDYNPDHFTTRRQYDRDWQPERGLYPDGWVAIICVVLALVALALSWYFNV